MIAPQSSILALISQPLSLSGHTAHQCTLQCNKSILASVRCQLLSFREVRKKLQKICVGAQDFLANCCYCLLQYFPQHLIYSWWEKQRSSPSRKQRFAMSATSLGLFSWHLPIFAVAGQSQAEPAWMGCSQQLLQTSMFCNHRCVCNQVVFR